MKRESRVFTLTGLRAEDDEGGKKLVGHAAVFNEETEIGGWYREKIEPGAFKESIQKDDIRALWNHNPDFVLGRKASKTLSLAEDKKGLAVEIDPPDTQWARDALVTIDRGDVTQMSFAFETLTDDWHKEEGVRIRTLKKLKLYEVSPVTFPAYEGTDIGLRTLAGELGVDLDALAGILVCHARGLELDDGDREVARRTLRALEDVVREPGHGLDLLRRRLDLAG